MRRTSLARVFLCVFLAACGSGGGDDSASDAGEDGSFDATSGSVDGAGSDAQQPLSDATGGDSAAAGDDGSASGDDGSVGGDDAAQGDDGGVGDAANADASDAAGGSDAGDSGGNSLKDSGGTDANASCGVCDSPPDLCHATTGTCQSGQCVYAFVTGAACDDGNACTVNDTCANGACAGTALQCTTPPAPVCLSGSQSITHDAQGTCNGGLCVYASHTTTCPSGPCTNGVCTSDPCSGITCATPPSVCYTSAGACSGGSCSYPYADGTTCNDGNACTTNDSCNTGDCKGAPVACDSPPASTCVNTSTLKSYASSGVCSIGACSYTYSFVDCPAGCANDACTPSGWTTMTSNTSENLWAVWGSSANAVWAVGEGGTAVFYNGTQWQVRPVPSQATGAFMVAIHGSAANDVYALAQKALIHYDGNAWSFVANLPGQYCSITTGVFATGDADHDAYVSCWWSSSDQSQEYDTLYKVSGAGVVTQVGQVGGYLGCVGYAGGVWEFSPTDVWMSGCAAQEWNGSSIVQVSIGAPSSAQIWATGPSSVFTIAYNENQDGSNVIEWWNGSVWSPLNSGLNGTLSAISGSSSTRVFAAGYDAGQTAGTIVFYDGVGFTNQVLPSGTKRLQGIWAAQTGQVFSVGSAGTIVTGP